MSGFAGVFHLDGAPVDRAWLETMAGCLAFRGPDCSQIWVSGSAGLCHTLFRTTAETDGRPQITSLDGNAWIAGDIRIDDRETLFAKLSLSPEILKTCCSTELVLHAYSKWGEDCVEHLLGDFSFVIWDARRKRLFGARDQLGIRPLFYAHVGHLFIISNTLDCVRQISIVPAELNERAIGDFLLVGENKDPSATFFTAIRRLAASHCLSADGTNGVQTKKYWTLPIEDPVYFKHANDYVDRFRELLGLAVLDRLPQGKLGILMSGGLDSPAIAATAIHLGAEATAFTQVYERLISDEEGHYAGLVAAHLRMPIRYHVRDDEPWGWEGLSDHLHTTEPLNDPFNFRASWDYFREISGEGRVFFLGDGPDAALFYEWQPHVRWLLAHRKWGRLGKDLIADLRIYPRVPLLHRLPRLWGARGETNADWYVPSMPNWINPEFEARLGLQERWGQISEWPPSPHPTRGFGYSCFACDFPMGGGDLWDASFTGVAVNFLHPLWDLRLLRFLFAVPTMPWCRNKYLIRAALKGLIPEAVRNRPKSPLSGHPYLIRARRSQQPQLTPVAKLEEYVDFEKVPQWPGKNREELDSILRVLGLHYWILGL